MWTTQERCPHAHSLNNKYKSQTTAEDSTPTDSPEEAFREDLGCVQASSRKCIFIGVLGEGSFRGTLCANPESRPRAAPAWAARRKKIRPELGYRLGRALHS